MVHHHNEMPDSLMSFDSECVVPIIHFMYKTAAQDQQYCRTS